MDTRSSSVGPTRGDIDYRVLAESNLIEHAYRIDGQPALLFLAREHEYARVEIQRNSIQFAWSTPLTAASSIAAAQEAFGAARKADEKPQAILVRRGDETHRHVSPDDALAELESEESLDSLKFALIPFVDLVCSWKAGQANGNRGAKWSQIAISLEDFSMEPLIKALHNTATARIGTRADHIASRAAQQIRAR